MVRLIVHMVHTVPREQMLEIAREAKAGAEDQTKSQLSNFADSRELSPTEHQQSPLSPGTNIENSNGHNIDSSDNNNDNGNDDPNNNPDIDIDDEDYYDCIDDEDEEPYYIEPDEPAREDTTTDEDCGFMRMANRFLKHEKELRPLPPFDIRLVKQLSFIILAPNLSTRRRCLPFRLSCSIPLIYQAASPVQLEETFRPGSWKQVTKPIG